MGTRRERKRTSHLYLRVLHPERGEDPAHDEHIIRAALAGDQRWSMTPRFERHERGGYSIWVAFERDRTLESLVIREVSSRLAEIGFGLAM